MVLIKLNSFMTEATNQWTSFFVIRTFAMKELIEARNTKNHETIYTFSIKSP